MKKEKREAVRGRAPRRGAANHINAPSHYLDGKSNQGTHLENKKKGKSYLKTHSFLFVSDVILLIVS